MSPTITSPPPDVPAATAAPAPSGAGAGEIERARAIAAAVVDPEIPALTIADLGILRGVSIDAGTVVVRLTPTYTGCPAVLAIELAVDAALLTAGVVPVRIVRELAPPWTTDDITEEGRAKLAAVGIAPPPRGASGGKATLFADEVVACPRCGATATETISAFGATACKSLRRCTRCREPFEAFKCL